MAQINFNANNIEPQQALDPVPPGWYQCTIVGSELKPTANRNGQYIALEFQIGGGQYNGRKVFTNLNIDNPNPTAVEIAQQQLSAICHATGQLVVQDTNQLHGKPLMVKVGIEPQKEVNGKVYEARNNVKGFKAVGNAQQAPPAQQAAQAPQTAQAPVQAPPAQPQPPAQQDTPPAQPQPQGGAPTAPPWANQ